MDELPTDIRKIDWTDDLHSFQPLTVTASNSPRHLTQAARPALLRRFQRHLAQATDTANVEEELADWKQVREQNNTC